MGGRHGDASVVLARGRPGDELAVGQAVYRAGGGNRGAAVRAEASVTFERTNDYGLVRAILTDEGIYEHMTDDFAPAREAFEPVADWRIWYVLVMEGSSLYGMFCFYPENEICWHAHVALFRGTPAAVTHQAGREVVDWLFANTGCLRLVASVPACNRAAVRFGQQAMGLRVYGRNERSFRKGGRLWDQILMGRSK